MEFNPNLLLHIFNEIEGAEFIGIREYESKEKGIANYTVLVGASYANILKNDLKKLKSFDIKTLYAEHDKGLLHDNLDKMIKSIETRLLSDEEKDKLRAEGNATLNRSDAQSDAYDSTGTALRAKDENIHILGYVIAKEIIKPDESSGNKYSNTPNAQAKRAIEKGANLTQSKARTFIINQAQKIVIHKNEFQKTS